MKTAAMQPGVRLSLLLPGASHRSMHGWLVDDGLQMPRAKIERSQGHVETIALFATEPSWANRALG